MLRHTPVLAQEIYDNLPSNWTLWFDGTFWHWGHAEFFLSHEKLKRSISGIKIVGTDIDYLMIKKAKELTKEFEENINILHSSYSMIENISKKESLFDYELLDLWVNLEHFKDASRWFSIKYDAPLDMRFDQTNNKITARERLLKENPTEIQEALQEYWDFSQKTSEWLTKLICEERKKNVFETTFQFKDFLIKNHFNQKKIAVIFQVIRIKVNKELDQLKVFLNDFPTTLKKGWRCFIITYHSVEDRITKNAFKDLAEQWEFRLINKKVIVPHYTEIEKNKAARSAKLRIIEKI